MKICKGYCGVSCIDGTCPIANRDEYEERGYDVISSCEDCNRYKGCEDCRFSEGEESKYCVLNTRKETTEVVYNWL